jgi:L-idonate 5-dehydrogenase
MKAFLIRGKLDAGIEEIATPEPALDEVRIRVAFVGICGSDLHYYFDGANGAFVVKEPLIPGHELSGTIDLDPSGEYAVGTPVTVHPATLGKSEQGIENQPNIWPGGGYLGSASTWPHTQGAMSEFLIMKRTSVRVLPASLTLKDAALAEPLGVSLHAINIAGGVEGKKVLISGSGPIGILTTAAAKVSGAIEIVATDLLPAPLARAKQLGATSVLKIGADAIPENYFDVVFECSGAAPAISAALVAVRRGGTVVQVGMLGAGNHAIAIAPLVAKEIQLRGTFRFNGEVDQAVEVLSKNPWIAEAITHVFPFNSAEEAFSVAKDSENSGKVLVEI